MEKRCIFCMEETVNERGVCASCGKSQWEYVWNRRYIAPYTTLQGKYIIGAVLGSGSFGVTYTGFDTVLEHRIAIKEFFPKDLVSRDQNGTDVSVAENALELFSKQKQAFRNESLLLSGQLSTPGVCNVIDFFEENNTAYIVEEYLPGKTLRQYLAQQPGNKISWERCRELFAPVLTGLCHVHSLGVVHCDISPDNLMFDADGSLKLIDFGAAKRIKDETAGQTPEDSGQRTKHKDPDTPGSADSKMFKEAYAAPEQYGDSHKIGPWTDLYAVCAVIFLALTGERPASSPVRISRRKPLAISPYTAIPQDVEAAILQGMNLDIQRRYFYTGILMERLGMDTGSVKPLTGRFRNEWGGAWLEIFTQDSLFMERRGLFARIRRYFTKDRLKHILVGTAAAAGVCLFLGTVVLVYARTYPEQVLRFRAGLEQKLSTRKWPSVQQGTVRYAKILELLSDYEHEYTEYNETTSYTVPSSFLIRQELVSGEHPVFPLRLPLAKQIIEYYMGQMLTEFSSDELCTVCVTEDKPLDVLGFVESSYSYRTTNGTYENLTISYDAVTLQVSKITLWGYWEDITLFLRDIFPYFVPEAYLTDEEIEGLYAEMESDSNDFARIRNHALFYLSLSDNYESDDSGEKLIWMDLESRRSGISF